MRYLILMVVLFFTSLPAYGQLEVGDLVPDFSANVCANGRNALNLYDFNGAENGSDYHVIFIEIFTSW